MATSAALFDQAGAGAETEEAGAELSDGGSAALIIAAKVRSCGAAPFAFTGPSGGAATIGGAVTTPRRVGEIEAEEEEDTTTAEEEPPLSAGEEFPTTTAEDKEDGADGKSLFAGVVPQADFTGPVGRSGV